MLDHEPDTDQPSSNDDQTPAAAPPPRRRRAASRPAGPPAAAPIIATTPAVTDPDAVPVSPPAEVAPQVELPAPELTQTEVPAPVEVSQLEVPAPVADGMTTPVKKTTAKRAPRKTAAKKTAAPVVEAVDPTSETTEASADAVEAPRKRAPRKRAVKKVAEPSLEAPVAELAVAAAPEAATTGPAGWDAPSDPDEPVAEDPESATGPELASPPAAEFSQPTAPVADLATPQGEGPTQQAEPRDFRWLADPFAVPVATAPVSSPTETAAESAPAGADAESDDVSDAESTPDESSSDEANPDEANPDEASSDADDDESGDGGNRRRRRRRGGRRRRRSSGDASDAGDDDNDSGADDSGAKSSTPAVSDASAAVVSTDAEATGGGDTGDDSAKPQAGAAEPDAGSAEGDDSEGQGRRRRRRRRRGEDAASAPDDPTDVVVRVREPRARARKPASDEVTGIQGSTRMEAKRQRRKEGRDAGRRRAPILSEAEFLTRRESVNRQMIIRQREDLTQIAVLEDRVLVEHYVDRESAASLIGNVYLGRVQNVLPSMEAAFIDIGRGRNAVLYAGEVDWDSFGAEGHNRKVEKVLKSGQMILVQVSKDPVGAKGARLTNHVSIPGRYIVYAPGGHLSGISRKLPDVERRRLKDILADLVGESASVIVRTAAEGASEEELVRDVNRLKAQWQDIERKVKAGNSPQLLYGEPDLTVRIVRDLFTEDFSQLIVQGNGAMNDAYDAIQGYVTHVAPHLQERITRWESTDGSDLFGEYRLDEQIAKALERKVFLPSGGSLVIDRTEAMTVIDVNTGKFTGSGGNLEATVTSNNLEAAEEIVNQLRLRDIGGIIVIDFIDMVLPSNRELLLRRLVECLGRDRTRHQVAEVTSLGLVQMTRKKIGTGLLEAFGTECPTCHGLGYELHDMPVDTQKQADGGAREPQRPRDHRPRPGDNVRGAGPRGDGGRNGARHESGAQPVATPEAQPSVEAPAPDPVGADPVSADPVSADPVSAESAVAELHLEPLTGPSQDPSAAPEQVENGSEHVDASQVQVDTDAAPVDAAVQQGDDGVSPVEEPSEQPERTRSRRGRRGGRGGSADREQDSTPEVQPAPPS